MASENEPPDGDHQPQGAASLSRSEGPPTRLLRWWNHAAALAVAAAVLLWGPWQLWFRIVIAVSAVVVPLLWEQLALRTARRRWGQHHQTGDRG